MHWYEDTYCYYLWKPHHIPTTFGIKESFIEQLSNNTDPKTKEIIAKQSIHFSYKEEFGLLNRLDNDTAGLLYFAKTPWVCIKYKQAQNTGNIQKIYTATVNGKLNKTHDIIAYPIAHHRHLKDRMVVLTSSKKNNKTRWKIHYLETHISVMHYDKKTNTSDIMIRITKGIRHQIRAHLASIGYPIIGDTIYSKQQHNSPLQLRSIGLFMKD
jgi:23S rRNA-/tRNA-specific pseudouridylate synthase